VAGSIDFFGTNASSERGGFVPDEACRSDDSDAEAEAADAVRCLAVISARELLLGVRVPAVPERLKLLADRARACAGWRAGRAAHRGAGARRVGAGGGERSAEG
jgi:hypothetical protein